jgi:hypothetical protein
MTVFHQRVNAKQFKEDWASELTFEELADKYEVTQSTIRRAGNAFNLGPRKRGRRVTRGKNMLSGGDWVGDKRGIQRWVPHKRAG